MDAKAERGEKRLWIKYLALELGLKDLDQFTVAFVSALREFVVFNGCESLAVERVSERGVKKAVLRSWKSGRCVNDGL